MYTENNENPASDSNSLYKYDSDFVTRQRLFAREEYECHERYYLHRILELAQKRPDKKLTAATAAVAIAEKDLIIAENALAVANLDKTIAEKKIEAAKKDLAIAKENLTVVELEQNATLKERSLEALLNSLE